MNMPLSKTNPSIRDPEELERLVTRSVIISSHLEGIQVSPDQLSGTADIVIPRRPKRIYQSKAIKR